MPLSDFLSQSRHHAEAAFGILVSLTSGRIKNKLKKNLSEVIVKVIVKVGF